MAAAVTWVNEPLAAVPTFSLVGDFLAASGDVLQRLPGLVGLHRHHQRFHADARDRHEVLVGQLHVALQMAGADRVGIPHDRVAVGGRAGDMGVADRAAGAGTEHRHHRLAERLAHLVGQHLGDGLGGGAEQHGHLDRLVRIFRARGAERRQQQGRHAGGRRGKAKDNSPVALCHVKFLPLGFLLFCFVSSTTPPPGDGRPWCAPQPPPAAQLARRWRAPRRRG